MKIRLPAVKNDGDCPVYGFDLANLPNHPSSIDNHPFRLGRRQAFDQAVGGFVFQFEGVLADQFAGFEVAG